MNPNPNLEVVVSIIRDITKDPVGGPHSMD